MITSKTSKALAELHRVREQLAQEYQGLPPREMVPRIRQEVDALIEKRRLKLSRPAPPSRD